MSETAMPREERGWYFIDEKDRVWHFDELEHRWRTPDVVGLRCNWRGLESYAGPVRRATPAEIAEIDTELFT